ncbi:hypothetical protein ACFQ4K_34240 [Tistrella bauzanensis]
MAGLLAALWLRPDQDPLAVERRCYALGLNLTVDRAGRLSLSLPLIVTASDIDRVVAVLAQALPAAEPVALPAVEPVALPAVEPVALPAVEPVALPAVEPVALPAVEPVALPAMEPVALPAMEPVALPGD